MNEIIMEIYEETLKQMLTVVTLSSHMKSLSQINIKVQDDALKKLINAVIHDLQSVYVNPRNKKKSLPIALVNAQQGPLFNLKKYCEKMLVNRKPEWQVEAERQGWSPPQGK